MEKEKKGLFQKSHHCRTKLARREHYNTTPRDYKGDRDGIPHIHPIP